MMIKFWDYNNFFSPPIPAELQFTLGEGSTPVYAPLVNWSRAPKTGQPVDNFSALDGAVRAKKEFLNPTGTHKDRSFAYWISYWYERGIEELAIASSGNSAISAAAYCKKAGIQLHAFVSPHLSSQKKERLMRFDNVILHEEASPRKMAIQYTLARGIPNLLASKHDEGTEGYKTIAFEIAKQLPGVTHLFIPTSSGATLRGIYRGFEIVQKEQGIAMPRLYAVQTTKVHPIAEVFDPSFVPETESYAEAIVDRVSPRRNEIIHILRETKGGAYVISNKELREAAEVLEDKNLGWQSVLAFAGFVKFALLRPQASDGQANQEVKVRPVSPAGETLAQHAELSLPGKQKAQQDTGLMQGTKALCLFTDRS